MFVFLVAVIVFSAFIQGVTSFGFSLIALPLLALWMPMREIVPLLVILSLALNVTMLWSLYRHVTLRTIGMLLVGGFLGIPLGIGLLNIVPSTTLKQVAGLVIFILSLLLLSGKKFEVAVTKRVYLTLGGISGIMQGALSLSGPPLVLFLSNQGVEKNTFRANLTAYFTAMNIVSLPAFLLGGMVDQSVVTTTLWSLPGMVLGIFLGGHLANRMPDQVFRRIALGLMCLAGLMAMVTA